MTVNSDFERESNRVAAQYLLDMIIFHGRVYRHQAIKKLDEQFGAGKFTCEAEPGLFAISKDVLNAFGVISKGKVTYSQKGRYWVSTQLGSYIE